ncbi:C6 zinc finger domain protein [Cordyceps fumosorosea ARSEF 2679]|uniref:C6 zinc finger domain protein n=1 Tax=Cordyceps fumosorosea (strain ARSEF 2679) TaxID=1081104 RepID=A0A167RNY9_CORFA|nr:C6 zinc finger domain protein [Cordyceps fumosorosea ARSEF 2679]OAA58782.1 C6 zinc finger domain protein [Cordyceps fumosorosea ARSEF 2679]
MTSQFPTEGAGPKLRTSCDRCQLSKVRCSRGKPSCWRCSQSGVECVYSPLRKTGRPPKNSDGSSGSCSPRHQRRDKSAARRGSSNTARSDSPRRGSVQRGRPPLPQEGGAGRHSHASAHSLYRRNDTSVTGPVWHTGMDAMVSREPSMEHAALLSLPMMQVGGNFSSLSVADLVPDINMWTMHSMPELDLHDAHADAGLQPLAGTHSDEEASQFLGGAMLTPLTTAAQDTHHGTGYHGLQAREGGFFSSLESSAVASSADDGATTGTYFPIQTPVTSSPSYTTTSHTSSTPISPDERRRPEKPPRSCARDDATCHRALSDMLIKLGDLDPGTTGGSGNDGRRETLPSLEALLGIERELRGRARAAMGCRRCVDRPSGQNLVMVTAMALDSLLVLFERQGRREEEGEPAADRVVRCCDDVLALLAELDLLACSVMQGVNSVIYKHKSEDLYNRACQLSSRFLCQLAPGMHDSDLTLLYE